MAWHYERYCIAALANRAWAALGKRVTLQGAPDKSKLDDLLHDNDGQPLPPPRKTAVRDVQMGYNGCMQRLTVLLRDWAVVLLRVRTWQPGASSSPTSK